MIHDSSKNISTTNISVDHIVLISVLLDLTQGLIHGRYATHWLNGTELS